MLQPATKIVYWVKGEGERKCDAQTITHHLPPADWCQPVSRQRLLWKDSPHVIAEHDDSMMSQCGTLPWSVWVNSPSCVPPQALGHPILLTGAEERASSREGLDTIQALLSNRRNMGALSTLSHSTIPAAITKVDSIPTRPSIPSKLQTV